MLNIILGIAMLLQTSIYSFSITNTEGTTIPLSQYEGKKIMLVNIATGSERVSQLSGLQQLHQQYGDSLVIIAFPSNSFGHEARSNADIKQFCQANYNAGFIIAAKDVVTGPTAQPVYSWLGNATANGATAISLANDFQKILLDKYGDIIGVYAPTVSPTDNSIINAITGN